MVRARYDPNPAASASPASARESDVLDRPTVPSSPRAQGNSSTKLEKAIDGHIPNGERYYGLENFGNTCYANSVLQALYFCKPFREGLLDYYERLPATHEENLLTCLGELFFEIASQKKRTGVYSPKRFIARLKHDNELFRSFMHQDAHEFFNYTLNECCEILSARRARGGTGTRPMRRNARTAPRPTPAARRRSRRGSTKFSRGTSRTRRSVCGART